MSSKKVNEKSQATKKMVRITIEVKKEIAEKYEGGMRIQDLADAYHMPKTTVSTIVKNTDVIKSANVAEGVKSLTKQRFPKFYWKGTLLPNNNISSCFLLSSILVDTQFFSAR